MTATKQVTCQDGRSRTFHQTGIKSYHGFVYESGHRVYGELAYDVVLGAYGNTFTAQGKHAWTVQPAPSEAALATS